MVGRAGEPKGSPGSFLTGSSNPARLTTSQRLEPLGGDSNFKKGVQP
nr:ash family protein [Serratia proteamaculans]